MFDPKWDTLYQGEYGADYPSERVMRNYGQYKPTSILDIGCGNGQNIHWLALQGCQVTGIDASRSALDRARKRLGDLPHSLLHMTLPALLPHDSDTFDAVLDIEGAICFPFSEACKVYDEAQRVLKPGGWLLVKALVDGCSTLYDHCATHHRTLEEMKELLKRFRSFNLEMDTRDSCDGHVIREWILTLKK